jgi:hypothetical protein
MTIIEVLYSCLIAAAAEIDLIKIVVVVVVVVDFVAVAVVVAVDLIGAVVIGVDNDFDLSSVIATIPSYWRVC